MMNQFRWLKNTLHSNIMKKFCGQPLNETTRADVVRFVYETAERLAGPALTDYLIERDEGSNQITITLPRALASIVMDMADQTRSQHD